MHIPSTGYPADNRARDEWILARRTARQAVDPNRPHGYFLEDERSESGEIIGSATVFLTNRECPWRCLMCDLWKNSLTRTVPTGAIPGQIDYALEKLAIRTAAPAVERGSGSGSPSGLETGTHPYDSKGAPTRLAPKQIKLYNGGSFFDPQAIPPADYEAIAERACPFERVVVECHPAFVRDSCLGFRDGLVRERMKLAHRPNQAPQLEVAMGLETVHPQVLQKLNKRMTLDQFSRAAEFLKRNSIALRVFVLVKPPFMDDAAGLYWAERSLDFAFDAGATVVSLIPTRAGNGALEILQAQGQFSPPNLSTLESAHAYGVRLHRGRVFADLWNLATFSECACCFSARANRMQRMNLEQTVTDTISCSACGNGLGSPRPANIPSAEAGRQAPQPLRTFEIC